MGRLPRTLILLALGATIGTVCDHLHVLGGVLAYPAPFAWSQAYWVPPLFAGATLALADGHALTARPLDGAPPPISWPRFALTFALFVLAYAFTAFVPAQSFAHDVLVFAVIGGGWLAFTVATSGLTRGFLIYALGAAVIGTGVEVALTQLGAFRYLRPTLSTVAFWLPGLYLWAASLGRALDVRLARDS